MHDIDRFLIALIKIPRVFSKVFTFYLNDFSIVDTHLMTHLIYISVVNTHLMTTLLLILA